MLPELGVRPIALIAYNYRGSILQELKLELIHMNRIVVLIVLLGMALRVSAADSSTAGRFTVGRYDAAL
jgi:hypothetical protein